MLPEPAARGAFDRAGRWAAGRDGKGIRQLRANLRVVTGGRLTEPELADLTTRAVRSYARYWQEAFRLPTLTSERIVTGTEVVGLEHLREGPRDEGRGLVMALPHSGNWDAAAVWFIDFLDGPFMTVAERLKPESLYRAVPRLPRVPRHAGRAADRRAAARAPRCCASGWPTAAPTCLLVDRNLGTGGVPVDFFGRPATMPGGAALLAAQTGAALDPDRLPVHRARLAAGVLPGGARRRAGPAQGPRRRRRCRPSPTPSPPRSPTGPRTGTCSAGSGPTCRRTRRRRPRPGAGLMRIGLVCPYQWDVPGGVQYHVRDLAETLRGMGHHVEVLTPAEREESLADE